MDNKPGAIKLPLSLSAISRGVIFFWRAGYVFRRALKFPGGNNGISYRIHNGIHDGCALGGLGGAFNKAVGNYQLAPLLILFQVSLGFFIHSQAVVPGNNSASLSASSMLGLRLLLIMRLIVAGVTFTFFATSLWLSAMVNLFNR